MAQGNDIDPRLRDIIQQSNPGQSDTSLVSTSSPSVRSQPILQSPHQLQTSQHPQQYDPYVQSHNGAHSHAYYGPSSEQQYGQSESPADLRAFPAVANLSHPGLQWIAKAGVDSKRLRACEACRSLKVRCEPDPNGGPCKRCLKAGRKCEITAPSRKRQKKTDSRVSELEKQLADIQSQLRNSGQIASDGEGQSYSDKDSMLIERSDRLPASQPLQPRSRNENNRIGRDAEMRFGDTQSRSQELPRSDMDRDGSLDGPDLSSPKPPLPISATPSFLSQENVITDISMIARSLDAQLAVSLMTQYVTSMLPQRPKIGAVLVDKVTFLQQSKPVLFLAIMILMLQSWSKDAPQSRDSTNQGVGSEKSNQALHLLSEVAMGNSGQSERERKATLERNLKSNGNISQQYLANVFIRKLSEIDDEEAEMGDWFDELTQGFY